jgi:hypothetical protein
MRVGMRLTLSTVKLASLADFETVFAKERVVDLDWVALACCARWDDRLSLNSGISGCQSRSICKADVTRRTGRDAEGVRKVVKRALVARVDLLDLSVLSVSAGR